MNSSEDPRHPRLVSDPEATPKGVHIAIVGAGVSGLTCGVLLAEQGFRVTIFAREFSPHTTSDIPAAVWYPYHIEPKELTDQWAVSTLKDLRALASIDSSGVRFLEFRCVTTKGSVEPPEWATNCEYRELKADELQGFRAGYSVRVPLMETPRYLGYLQRRFKRAGGSFVRRSLRRLTEIANEYPMTVNCSGLGARELCDDPYLREGRGVIVYGSRTSLPYAIANTDDQNQLMYIIPRSRDCVIGGIDNDSRVPEATGSEVLEILERARNIDPRLEPNGFIRTGMRPLRDVGVRLEIEEIDGCSVIHNYGHGGAGFTVSWGCARRVAELVGECLNG